MHARGQIGLGRSRRPDVPKATRTRHAFGPCEKGAREAWRRCCANSFGSVASLPRGRNVAKSSKKGVRTLEENIYERRH